MSPLLSLRNLKASIGEKRVLHGVDLTINEGEMHVLMGPNGSGKSSLGLTLMGHPGYTVHEGSITFAGKDITELSTDERARLGMFVSLQNPMAVPGVSVGNLTRTAFKTVHPDSKVDFKTFRERITNVMDELRVQREFLDRSVNDGFSGGEKKTSEILQMRLLEPKFAILDEPDSGLDIDALKRIAASIQALRDDKRAFLVITHYQRILEYLTPDVVHVFIGGKIVQTGGMELVHSLEKSGYDQYSVQA